MIAMFAPELIGCIVVIILQAVVAPYLVIGLAVPNLILSFAVAYAVASRRTTVCIMPFIAGLAYDLLGSGPVGAMALLTMIACLVATNLVARFGHDAFFMPIVSIIGVIFLVHILYAVICVTCGWNVGLGEALLYRSLPGGLYDTVVALVMYPLCRFILRPKPSEMDLPSIG